MSDYERLRQTSRDVQLSLGHARADMPSTAAIQRAAGDRVNGLSGYTSDEVVVRLAAAAEVLADLGPVLDAFFAAVRLSATSSDGAVDMNYDVCMDALLTSWTTARAKLVTT